MNTIEERVEWLATRFGYGARCKGERDDMRQALQEVYTQGKLDALGKVEEGCSVVEDVKRVGDDLWVKIPADLDCKLFRIITDSHIASLKEQVTK